MSSIVKRKPRVSIGLPVYNGEKYLEKSIESILRQTFEDFELIISDNASTDRTKEICMRYAQQDQRVKYSRNERNIGGTNNGNLTFTLSSGDYFRLAGYDDIYAPELLSECVDVLDNNPSIVLCFSTTVDIDEHGNQLTIHDRNNATSERPSDRFRNLIDLNHKCEEIYGLIRSNIILKTKLQQNYTDSDRTLISEFGLYGKFILINKPLFFRRVHSNNSTGAFPNWRERMQWFDARNKNRIVLPHWMQFFDYMKTIARVPISVYEKLHCYKHMIGWLFLLGHGRWMTKDLLLALGKIIQNLFKLRIHGTEKL